MWERRIDKGLGEVYAYIEASTPPVVTFLVEADPPKMQNKSLRLLDIEEKIISL